MNDSMAMLLLGLHEIAMHRNTEPATACELRAQYAWGVDAETHCFWRAQMGNAKARRRWKRRSIPNSQMLKALDGRARESVSDVREVTRSEHARREAAH